MEQVRGLPPRFEEIAAVFPGAREPGVIFSWGTKIYVPDGRPLPPELVAHEEVHGARQAAMGLQRWWDSYLIDPEFRLGEEVPAHIAEYREFCRTNRDRNIRAQFLSSISQRLASPLYGGLVTIRGAQRLILDKGR
jgi:hypothetical protein